jgi:hypothetical protein
VVEGAPRGIQLVQHVLDAHLLVALGLDEALGYVDERFLPDGAGFWIYGSRQSWLLN